MICPTCASSFVASDVQRHYARKHGRICYCSSQCANARPGRRPGVRDEKLTVSHACPACAAIFTLNVQQRHATKRGHRVFCSHACFADINRRYVSPTERVREATRRGIATLSDGYVRKLLATGTELPASSVPPALVRLQRAHLLVTRQLKEMRNGSPI